MYIPKVKAKRVTFLGFDGRHYQAVTCGMRNGILTLKYRVPGFKEMATAYLIESDFDRLSRPA